MNPQEALDTLQPAFLMLIEGALATLVPLLLWKLNAWAKSKVHDSRFHCAMDKITTVSESSVLDIGQTYTKAVRKSGKWTDESATEAKRKAMELAKKRLGPAGLKELMGCLGHKEDGVTEVLAGAIESAVVKFKGQNALPTGGHESAEPKDAQPESSGR